MPDNRNTSENQRSKWREYKREQRQRQSEKPLARAPSKFFEIMGYFERQGERSQSIRIEMDSEQNAQALKFKWYEFKKSLKGPANTTHPGWRDLCERVLLRTKGFTLEWSWRDNDQMLSALNQLTLPEEPLPESWSALATIPAKPASDDDAYIKYFPKEDLTAPQGGDMAEQLTPEEALKREMLGE